ncbi:hypothetical protein PRZ48_005556 [Zasmidium cellare]|uniref:Rhodopsin domain-containing protein n=1 Tax=Zasmidium cellare TaxID=395010 RepID=A0ABR0EMU2_ZASCE|nr:hypothetical protein PRZ48_005556 [Zasmidium cellare]
MGYDDSIMLIAWIFSVGFMASSYVSVRWGVGLESSDAPPSWPPKAIQAVYAIEIFYYFSVYLIKTSLVFLYLRLSRELRNHLYKGSLALLAVLTLHFITTVIVFSVQCVPMKKYWDPPTPGHCISITGFFYSTNIFTIITDIVMLALPVKTVWKVQGSLPEKLGVVAAFLSGGLSTLASCIRLYSIKVYTESKEPLRDAAPINTWSFIEIYVGMCCASAAVIRQYVSISRQSGVLSGIGSSRKRTQTESAAVWSSSGRTLTSPGPEGGIARWPSPTLQKGIQLEAYSPKYGRQKMVSEVKD